MTAIAASAAAIDLRGLQKTYPAERRGRGKAGEVRAVDGLDLRVERGEVFGLLGPNGAGKTTTVEICEGLLPPTSGDVRILGLQWGRDDRELRGRIGVTLQSTRFFDKQTVRELIALFASFYADPRPIDDVLGLVALEQKADARFHTLSGGQQQRLAVACALAGRPDLLFLDEPTTGLDPQARRQLWEVVRTFRADGGTVLLTTHYMEEAAVLCDRIMIVDHGRSIALGTPAELVASLGAAHVIRAHFADREADASGAAPPPIDPASFAAVPTVHDIHIAVNTATLTVDEVHLALPVLLRIVQHLGLELADLTLRTTTLDDVFVHLTGRQLRDGDEARS